MLIPRCLALLCMFIVKAYMMISIQGNLFLLLDLNETASILPISNGGIDTMFSTIIRRVVVFHPGVEY